METFDTKLESLYQLGKENGRAEMKLLIAAWLLNKANSDHSYMSNAEMALHILQMTEKES